MTEASRLARKWVREYARLLPGSLDHNEAERCWLAGFEAAKKMALQAYIDSRLKYSGMKFPTAFGLLGDDLRHLGAEPAQGEGEG